MSTITPFSWKSAFQLGNANPRSPVSQTTAPAGPRPCFQLACFSPYPSFSNTSRSLHPIVPSKLHLSKRASPRKLNLPRLPDPTFQERETKILQERSQLSRPSSSASKSFRQKNSQRIAAPSPCKHYINLNFFLTPFFMHCL